MRSKLIENDVRVLTAKIEVLLAQDDIMAYVMAHVEWEVYPATAFNAMMALNKRQLFAYAKDTIRREGCTSAALNRVKQHNYSKWTLDQRARFRSHVSEMFPEID